MAMYSSVVTMSAAPAHAPSVYSGSASSFSPDLASMASNASSKKPYNTTAAALASKRKRDSLDGEDSGDSASPPPSGATTPALKNRDGQKKKKASRACVHCQKSHLTCDDCE
jgi:hypothetical protein